MKKRKVVYNLINILVLLAAALIFVFNYINTDIFAVLKWEQLAVITIAVVIVHFLKAFRLYLALYGSGLSIYSYSKIYCKVTPISILFPFKLGELFRMYCYGYQTDNMLKGVVTVILDRFMDTIALVTMIIVVWIASGGVMMPLVYFLLVFLVAAVLLFITFPGAYNYWKKFLLRADGTPRKLKMLRYMENINRVYKEIVGVSKGRGIILYVISLLAWSAEIGCVALLNRMNDHSNLSDKMSEYLTSALSSNQSSELKQFIFISVILMIIIYVLVKAVETVRGERN